MNACDEQMWEGKCQIIYEGRFKGFKCWDFAGAWIVSGGTNAGVMKHVGQAVRDYALSNSMQGQIVAIGVATWGVIHNREALIKQEVR